MSRNRRHLWVLVQRTSPLDRMKFMATKNPSKPPAPHTQPARGDDSGSVVLERRTQKTKPPQMYQVVMLNDDYTPMEFVIHVLERYFHKTRDEATGIMLNVHHEGAGVGGVYTYEVAETKVMQVMEFSRQHQHPLQCVMERE